MREILDTGVISKIRSIASDQERSIMSKKFQESVKKNYGATVYSLPLRHKSFQAERFIRTVKQHLSMAVEARKADGDKEYKNWVRLLPSVLRELNRKFIKGTRFRRNVVDDSNFEELLDAIYGPNSFSLWNTRVIDCRSIKSKKWKAKIWKFALGQKVLVRRKTLGRLNLSYKASVEGGYSSEPREVERRYLKSSGPSSVTPGMTNPSHQTYLCVRFSFLSLSLQTQRRTGRLLPNGTASNHVTGRRPWRLRSAEP